MTSPMENMLPNMKLVTDGRSQHQKENSVFPSQSVNASQLNWKDVLSPNGFGFLHSSSSKKTWIESRGFVFHNSLVHIQSFTFMEEHWVLGYCHSETLDIWGDVLCASPKLDRKFDTSKVIEKVRRKLKDYF